MITTGSKWFFGLSLVALVMAAAYGWSTGGNGLGPVTVGYKGGVGDHFGYTLLLAMAAIAAFLGGLSIATRDADAEALAEAAGTDTAPAAKPVRASYWPIVGAFAVACLILGLVLGPALFIIGLIAGGIVLFEWMVLAWSDHATGDPETNRQVRNRLMNPIEIPAAGAIAIAVMVFCISRVFLAVPEIGAVYVAMGVATLILIGGSLVAAKPKISSNAVAALLLLGAVAAIGAGVVSAAVGTRHIEKHVDAGASETTSSTTSTTATTVAGN
jgi:hypothetical protein